MMRSCTADHLGRRLRAAGFRPLPDVDDDGEMIGTRLWRVRAGYVEYLGLRPHGLAHAVRAEAVFDYQRPTEHGPVVDYHSGHVINVLNWLLTSLGTLSGRHPMNTPAPAVTWLMSTYDATWHAFSTTQVNNPTRTFYQALCQHSVPPRHTEHTAPRVFCPTCLVHYGTTSPTTTAGT